MNPLLAQEVRVNATIIVVIALLYSFFVSKLVDRHLRSERIDSLCDNLSLSLDGENIDPTFESCMRDRSNLIRSNSSKKLNYMLSIGTLSIVLGAQMIRDQQTNGRLRNVGFGGVLGGMMILVYYTALHWYDFNDDVKLAILGGVLATMGSLSYQMTSPIYF